MKREMSMKNRMIWESGIYGGICCIVALVYMLEGLLELIVGGIAFILLILFNFFNGRIKKEKHDEMSRWNSNKASSEAQHLTWILFLIIGVVNIFDIIPPLNICTIIILMMGVSRIIECILFIKFEREGI